jgi:hypothetical protein
VTVDLEALKKRSTLKFPKQQLSTQGVVSFTVSWASHATLPEAPPLPAPGTDAAAFRVLNPRFSFKETLLWPVQPCLPIRPPDSTGVLRVRLHNVALASTHPPDLANPSFALLRVAEDEHRCDLSSHATAEQSHRDLYFYGNLSDVISRGLSLRVCQSPFDGPSEQSLPGPMPPPSLTGAPAPAKEPSRRSIRLFQSPVKETEKKASEQATAVATGAATVNETEDDRSALEVSCARNGSIALVALARPLPRGCIACIGTHRTRKHSTRCLELILLR